MCYFIQDHYLKDEFSKMMEYYPSMIEAAIEFKVASRKILAKSRNEHYKFKNEHEVITHS